MNPSFFGTWIFGLVLTVFESYENEIENWLLIKIFLVFLMSCFHMYCAKIRIIFEQDKNTKKHIYYRYINEIPTLLFLLIIIMVVFKPFN